VTALSEIERPAERVSETTRWSQLVIGIICMVMIANLQYGWTLFTIHAGLLYTAKGTASLLVPLANVLVVATGGWKTAFIIASLFNVIAALIAIFVLKPMRQRLVARPSEGAAWVAGAQPT
jgi:uncharacterized membrane protein